MPAWFERLRRRTRPGRVDTDPAQPTRRVEELKTVLDGLVNDARQAIETDDDHDPVLVEACDNFMASGPELLAEATTYLWDYYNSLAGEFTASQQHDYGIPQLTPSITDIWDEVSITLVPEVQTGGVHYEPGQSYISFEGEVSWEPEHGLQLVIEHGQRVCKVGPYDGHNTNAHACADESLHGVIFR